MRSKTLKNKQSTKRRKKWNVIHFVESIIYKKSKTSLPNFPPYSSGALQKNTKRNFSPFLYVNKKILFLLPLSLFFTLKSSLYTSQSPTKEKQWKRNVNSFLKFKIKNSFFPFPISYQKVWFRVQAGALQKKIMKGNVKTFLKLKKKR